MILIIPVLTNFNPPQYTVNHPIFNAQNELLNFQNEIMEEMTSMCDMVGQYMPKKEEDKRIAEDQAAKDRYWKIPICYDDDDDEESYIPLKDIIISGLPPCVAITPILSLLTTSIMLRQSPHLTYSESQQLRKEVNDITRKMEEIEDDILPVEKLSENQSVSIGDKHNPIDNSIKTPKSETVLLCEDTQSFSLGNFDKYG
ncbi:hypothetical protein Tco_0600333 [Tanacetum coccineum]|uniref:Uncharacterized protein n=1 Tax=Tanacetum coccineum TaxID=301880 RepID=A0ABQ4WBI9_9ASTR